MDRIRHNVRHRVIDRRHGTTWVLVVPAVLRTCYFENAAARAQRLPLRTYRAPMVSPAMT